MKDSLNKDESVETLRGVACLLLVLYHVIGPPGGGLLVPDDSVYRYLNDTLIYVRMPLFTFLSGYVYAMRPVAPHASIDFMKGKFRRLYIPLISVGVPFGIIQFYAPGANHPQQEWWHAFKVLYESQNHFWFLQSLLLIFLAVVVLERCKLLVGPGKTLLVIFASFCLFLSGWGTYPYFSLFGAIYLAPFFFLGMLFKRHENLLHLVRGRLFWAVALIFAVAIAVSQLSLNDLIELDRSRRSALSLFVGVATCMFALSLGYRNSWMAWVGGYAFTIFLFHTYFTGLSRLLTAILLDTPLFVSVAVGLLSGIILPIVLHEFVIAKSRAFEFLFLGRSLPKRKLPTQSAMG